MSKRPRVDRRHRQLRKLTEVSRALTYAVSLDEVLRLTVERAAELLDAHKAVLMLSDEEGVLSVRASHGLDQAVCDAFREPLHETLMNRLHGLLGKAEQSILSVPLVVGGQVTGLLAVGRPAPATDAAEDEWLLSALADQAAVALEKTRLDETAEFRERLIGIVSHDLRNPISSILLGTELLLTRDVLDDRSIKTVVRMRSSASRAERMISDLLDFTQARLGGGISVQRKPMDLQAVVRHVVDEMEQVHPDRTFAVIQEGDGLGSWDFDRLAQVLGNLLSNAVHYSPAGSVVRVETRGSEHEVALLVQNAGPPIPVDRLPYVFKPMQRAAAELSSTSRSVGLGLYIVKHLVEAHQGRITLESTEGEGTTVTVLLPRS